MNYQKYILAASILAAGAAPLWGMVNRLILGDLNSSNDLSGDRRSANTQDEQSRKLFVAANAADLRAITKLITEGAPVNARYAKQQTPLHIVSAKGKLAAAQLLLSFGADLAARDVGGKTPLHWAADKGHRDIVTELIAKGADIHATSGFDNTALHYAARSGHVAVMEILIAHGAAVNTWKNKRETPLHLAAMHGHTEAVRVLLAHGAYPQLCTENMKTAFDLAHERNHKAVVRVFEEYNAQERSNAAHASLDDLRPTTPAPQEESRFDAMPAAQKQEWLDQAAACGDITTVTGLLKAKANPNIIGCFSQQTPLHSAAANGNIKMAELLLAHDASVEVSDSGLWTPLETAAFKGHKEVVALLIKHGARAHNLNNMFTTLNYAIVGGNPEVVTLILDNGGLEFIEKRCCMGHTPLQHAVLYNKPAIAQLLLDRGADAKALNDECLTALEIARRSENAAMIALLEKHTKQEAPEAVGAEASTL